MLKDLLARDDDDTGLGDGESPNPDGRNLKLKSAVSEIILFTDQVFIAHLGFVRCVPFLFGARTANARKFARRVALRVCSWPAWPDC